MTSDEFEAFLKDAGNVYDIKKTEGVTRIRFRDRGNSFCGYANETDPSFLYLTIDFTLSEVSPDADRLTNAMREIEDEYKLVKIKSLPKHGDDGPYLRVATEQLAADADAAAAIFWRSVDLMRDAGYACLDRLRSTSASTATKGEREAFVLELETALQHGCELDSKLETPSDGIRAALVLMLDDSEGSGSGFCVASSNNTSYYITNAHVVGESSTITLYRQCPSYEKMTGTVFAKGDTGKVDLAIVSVPVGNIPHVKISSKPPRRDEAICLTGYARVQIWAAEETGELQPASHFGTVTSVNRNGTEILHDALSRPGNSGGPLFSSSTGLVYGVQRGGWQEEEEGIAIGAPAILAFLAEHDLNLSLSAS